MTFLLQTCCKSVASLLQTCCIATKVQHKTNVEIEKEIEIDYPPNPLKGGNTNETRKDTNMRTPSTDRWRYRRQPRPVDPEDVGYYALAAGIVMQAVEDYKDADKKLKAAQFIEDPTTRARITTYYENIKDEIVKFFRGSWYATLCDIDPDRILRKLGAI